MQYLFDETGRRYLDLFAGIVTVSVRPLPSRSRRAGRRTRSSASSTPPRSICIPTSRCWRRSWPRRCRRGWTSPTSSTAAARPTTWPSLMARLYHRQQRRDRPAQRLPRRLAQPMALTSHHTWKFPQQAQPGVHHALNPDPVPQSVHGHAGGDRAQERGRYSRPDPLLDAGQDRRLHRRADPGRRRRDQRRAELLPGGLRHRPRARRALHRRRSANRLRPHRRPLLGLPELGRHARHRHHGQGHRQRRAARRGDHPARDRRGAHASGSTSTPSAATRSPWPAGWRCSTSSTRTDCRRTPAWSAAGSRRASRSCRRRHRLVGDVRGHGADARRRAGARPRTKEPATQETLAVLERRARWAC